MPGTTSPSKYPYPLSTEPVKEGAQRIRELAEWLQAGPPEIQVYRIGSFTMPVGWMKITGWSGATWASPNAAAQGMATNTNGISVPAGRYVCEACVTFPIDGGGTVRRIAIVPLTTVTPSNAADPIVNLAPPAGSGAVATATAVGSVTMTAAGQIAVALYTNGASQAVDATQLRFSARRVS